MVRKAGSLAAQRGPADIQLFVSRGGLRERGPGDYHAECDRERRSTVDFGETEHESGRASRHFAIRAGERSFMIQHSVVP